MMAVGSTGLVAFTVFLFLSVTGEQEVEIPEAELAKARLAYEQGRPARSAPASIAGPTPGRAARVTPRRPDPEPEAEAEAKAKAEPDLDEIHAAFGERIELPASGDFRAKRKFVRRVYDRKRYPSALRLARELLAERPRDIFLLRVVISAACFIGEPEIARDHWQRIRVRGKRARRQLVARCAEFGVELPDDPDAQ